MECLIISGRSGSGKSTALQALEDLGCYCVDNMPLLLLPDLLDQLQKNPHIRYLAVGIDARNLSGQLAYFHQTLDNLREKTKTCRVLFLDADTQVLLRRFNATRRRHPLSDDHHSLTEAIEQEGQILSDIRAAADIVIDSSQHDVHSLREAIRCHVEASRDSQMTVQISSFGFKKGVPQDADLMFDVRVLPNPYWQKELRPLSGHDDAVINFLDSQPDCQKMLDDIEQFLTHWLSAFRANDRSYLTIAIGCTGGQHRSVYIANKLAERLKPNLSKLQLRHRDTPQTAATS